MATTTGEKLVELSKLVTGTAIEHLLAIRTGGGVDAPSLYSIDITNTTGIGVSDGIITLFASGGTSPYTYSLGDNYQSGNTFTGLTENTYTVSVMDVSGHTDSISGIKLSSPSSETPIITNLIIVDTTTQQTNDGSIKVIANGGTTPYTYSLNGEDYQSSNYFVDLVSGTYDISVKDNNDVVNTLSGIKVGAKVVVKSGGGYGRGPERYRTKVYVKDVKLNEVKIDKEIKINVTL